jgi:Flp pilus assembly protein TadG
MSRQDNQPAATPQDAPKRRGLFMRFRRDKRGATVIEFALLALPFLALMLAIFETFLLLFASQTFETATQRGARLIRTGQAQEANLDAEEFKTQICEAMALLLNCMQNLMVDVRTYTDFGAVDLANPIDEDGNLITTFEYDPGDAGEIVVVRTFYEWPLHTNLLGLGLANLSNGKRLIASATAFRNEPF